MTTSFRPGETPTLDTVLELARDRWERQMFTAFPAKVTAFDDTNQVVEVEPAFYEVFRRDGERVAQALQPIPNVPILYPRGNGFGIYIPAAVGDWVLVVCTKYSIDRWRETARAGDPGDVRRFTLDGAIAIPGIYPNDPIDGGVGNANNAVFEIPAGKELHLGAANAASFIALATAVEAELEKVRADLAGITCNTGTIAHSVPYTTVGSVKSAKVKSE